uniref:GDP-Man:Man(3)GlcNAc(2)-PP-Dol alpha-1,2-mannosyltransferase n=1 Tax=Riptortus pedestris TaxID=329032 RepID=R4WK64_RIPPE|nr:glycosyl transferase [Riptortus pedestris]
MFLAFIYCSLILFFCFVLSIPFIIFGLKKHFINKRKLLSGDDTSDTINIAFFHPYCDAGGGGEKVLWSAILALQKSYPNVKIVVYTGDLNASPDEIIKRVYTRFNIKFLREVEFIYLHKRKWLEHKRYPYFTLLSQSFGSLVVGLEALYAYLPDIYIDSMGYSFTLFLFSYIGGCTTACYIHYPTITREMVKRVSSRRVGQTNRAAVAQSPFLTSAKLLYYRSFAWLYSFCGTFADTVMVNSSWTEEHINHLWGCNLSTHRVYPPCDTIAFKSLPQAPDISDGGPIKITSVGQYRPEKDHPLQLQALYELRRILPEDVWDRVKLVFIGSCRGSEDMERVKDMKDLMKHLSLENNVEFKVNIPFEELKSELSSSMIGLHAMWNEHFGIAVVECMAAGQIMVAHKSGGPKADIIEESEGSRNGFLASDEFEYARALATIIQMPSDARNKIREAARSSVDRFSTEEFEKGLLRTLDPLVTRKVKSS